MSIERMKELERGFITSSLDTQEDAALVFEWGILARSGCSLMNARADQVRDAARVGYRGETILPSYLGALESAKEAYKQPWPEVSP